MQDIAGCDNNRTPVVFQAPDIYRFVGELKLSLRTRSPIYGIVTFLKVLFSVDVLEMSPQSGVVGFYQNHPT